MPIAVDLAQNRNNGSSTELNLASVVCSGSNRILVVGVYTETTSKTISNLKFGGVSLTQLGTYQDVEVANHRISIWYLVAPTTVSGAVTGSISATDIWDIGAVSYTGVDQSSPFKTPNQSNDTATPGSTVETSDRAGSWAIGMMGSGNAGFNLDSGGSERQKVKSAALEYFYLVDSNAAVGNGSSNTFTWSWTSGNGGSITAMMRALLDATPQSNLLTLGVG